MPLTATLPIADFFVCSLCYSSFKPRTVGAGVCSTYTTKSPAKPYQQHQAQPLRGLGCQHNQSSSAHNQSNSYNATNCDPTIADFFVCSLCYSPFKPRTAGAGVCSTYTIKSPAKPYQQHQAQPLRGLGCQHNQSSPAHNQSNSYDTTSCELTARRLFMIYA